MKGHMQDGKFHPHTDYKKGIRKSRDQKAKTKGVKIRKQRNLSEAFSLSSNEQMRLTQLGKTIQEHLSCDVNESGLPCRRDRLEAVREMEEYLAIHDIGTRKSRNKKSIDKIVSEEVDRLVEESSKYKQKSIRREQIEFDINNVINVEASLKAGKFIQL